MASQDQYIIDALNSIRETADSLDRQVNTVDKNLAEYRVTFEHHVKQDEQMYQELRRMNDLLSQNTDSLKLHMKRTALLEEAVFKMDERLSPIEVERIRIKAVNLWLKEKGFLAAKVVGALTAAAGFWVALQPVFEHYFK